jgi:exonuclease III
MILLSINIRGVGGPLKSASMCRLLNRTHLDIIFLQETLVDEKRARSFITSLQLDWYTCTVSSVGKSGGLLVSWDPSKFDLTSYISCGGLFLKGTSLELKRHISFLNVYGPCTNIKDFWDKVMDRGLLSHKNMIVARDFNFTLSVGEIWGDSTQPNQLAGFFKELFLDNGLVDILPDNVVPSWRNDRSRSESIMKRLDMVFVVADFLRTIGRYRSWVAYPYISDHAPVILQFDLNCHTKAYPFKLNSLWLREDEFSRIVHEVWKDQLFLQETGIQRRLVWKLKFLKHRVKLWVLQHRSHSLMKLEKLEEDLRGFYQESSSGLRSREVEGQIKTLEKERSILLLVEEELWRQRNRATWIKSGDQNTKLFHHFASYRRNIKQVWEV